MNPTMTPDTYELSVSSERTFPAAPFPRKYVHSVFDDLQDAVQAVHQPPTYTPGPIAAPPTPPQKRPGRSGAIVLLVLVLALIFGVGLFAGWEFVGSSSSTATTSKATATATATSSGGTTIEAQQEAAIAKVEPAVVELKVMTAQGEQIGSGVIIDTKGDIVTNSHVVSGEQSIEAVLYNGSTEQAQLVGTVAADDLAVVRIQPLRI